MPVRKYTTALVDE